MDRTEHALTDRLLDACRTLRDLTEGDLSSQWDSIRNILRICRAVNNGERLNKNSLLTEFRRLERKDLLILHVSEQNAGLLIRQGNE